MLSPASNTPVGSLSFGMERVLEDTQARLLSGVRHTLETAENLTSLVPTSAITSRSESYTRHLIYSDPLGMYSAMLLVWHPGHHSPVHGHQTWCAYKVLRGALTERHYEWDSEGGAAIERARVLRHPGDIVSARAGLSAIHRLGNDTEEVAISLHIYGVERERISSHVNIVLKEACAALRA